MSRRKRSANNHYVLLRFDVKTEQSIVLRRIGYARGEQLCDRKIAARAYDLENKHIGYWELEVPMPEEKPEQPAEAEAIGSAPSSNVFSRAENEAIAGLRGRSRTERMQEDEKAKRVHPRTSRLEPEDLVELARAKLREWPLLHGDRAVRVYPAEPARCG
jgi:hypothetical protein